MPECLHIANLIAMKKICESDDDAWVALLQTNPMAKKAKSAMAAAPSHHLREWREAKNLTQEQLAERLNTTKGVISLLETGGRGLTNKWLRRIAVALGGIKPGWILDYSPDEIDQDLLETWAHIPESQRPHAINVLKTFRKAG